MDISEQVVAPFRSTVIVTGCVLSALTVFAADAMSQEEGSKPLMTGSALRKALDEPLSLNTAGLPLRDILRSVQDRTGVPILLDRRVDPTVVPRVSTPYVSVREVLRAVVDATPADSYSLSFGDHLVVAGPAGAAARLRTVTALTRLAIRRLKPAIDPDVYRKCVEPRQSSWPDLTEPRQLLLDRAELVGISIINPDVVPHDLWAAAILPPMPFGDWATIVLNQFDATFELAADGSLTIVPVDAPVVIERRHRVRRAAVDVTMGRWRQEFPDLDVVWRGTTAVVRASVETHERLAVLARGETTPTIAKASLPERNFTMTAPAGTPIGKLVESFREAGVPVRIEGRTEAQLLPLLRQPTGFDLRGIPGKDFFPNVFSVWDAAVDVRDDEVVVSFATRSVE